MDPPPDPVMRTAATRSPSRLDHEALRLAVAYVAVFALVGIYLPYWPVWLASRGVVPEQLGLLLGLGSWARLATPWIGAYADRTGRGPQLLVLVALGALGTLLAFAMAWNFLTLVLLSVVLGLAFAPVIPLLDGMSISAAAAGRMDYGRVRLWGSAAFIVASVAGGRALDGRDPALVLVVLQCCAAAVLIAVVWLRPMPVVPREPVVIAASWADVLRRPRFATFLLCLSFLQGAHALLYGFGTKHWQASGVSESTIGWFWGVGVVAEVVLFAYGAQLVRRIGSSGLLLVAGVGAIVRWSALGMTTAVVPTFAIQLLHAASFAAMHLGAMSWIRENIAGPAVHRATSVYVAVAGGIALGVAMPLGGVLFEHWRGDAYFAMTALAVVGTMFAWRLRPGAGAR